MEEAMVSPMFSGVLNLLALGLSVILLFAVAYLWSSNNHRAAELERVQTELRRLKKTVATLDENFSQMRVPTVVADVPQIEPFGIDLNEPVHERITPLAPQAKWLNFIEDYNKLAADPSVRGFMRKCERFIQENKLKILTYSSANTFRPAIDAKDSLYWAFRCVGEEYAVVPNPMNPCDEDLHENGGIKEIFALNYEDGVYRKYSVKLPAIFVQDPLKGWTLKNPGVANLERK